MQQRPSDKMEAVARTTARISLKHSVILCKKLKGKKLSKAKTFLQNLIEKKESIDGKYYTKASSEILKLLENVEANAKQKNMNVERLFISKIKADKGFTFILPKSKAKFRGRRGKVTNLEVVVEER
jgi:large subunit ribosomal protein L22